MTTIALLADPPVEGVDVLPRLAETSPLAPGETRDLYAAMFRDVARAAAASGGGLLVNYRPADALGVDVDSEAELRALTADALGVDSLAETGVRVEVQVGETFAGRVGNTVTHLLEREGVDSVAVVEPAAAFLSRPVIDGAAMKLRSSPVVLGPAPGGRVHFAAFADAVDFEAAYAPPALVTLADRARDAGHAVEFTERLPVVETGTDLADALTLIRVRRGAGRRYPEATAAALDELGLVVEAETEGDLHLRLARAGDDP